MNPAIINYWVALQEDGGFIDSQVAFSETWAEADEAVRECLFEQQKPKYDLEDDPLAFWVLNRVAIAARVDKQRPDIACLSGIFKRDGFSGVRREKLEGIRDFLRDREVRITRRDYRELLDADGDNVWLFLDPPYPMAHRQNDLYGVYSWSWEQQEQLAERLRACSHRWLLTNANCPRIRGLYDGFSMRPRRYTGSLPHRHQKNSKQNDRHDGIENWKTELIITNYH